MGVGARGDASGVLAAWRAGRAVAARLASLPVHGPDDRLAWYEWLLGARELPPLEQESVVALTVATGTRRRYALSRAHRGVEERRALRWHCLAHLVLDDRPGPRACRRDTRREPRSSQRGEAGSQGDTPPTRIAR